MTQFTKAASTSKPRLPQIDIAKAILIILVVIGHTHFTYSKYIYWFHMPCFFIISGYLLKPQDIRYFFKKKSISYFIPLFLFGVIDLLLSNKLTILGILQLLYNGRVMGGVYWFVPCLLLSSLTVLIVEKFCKSYKTIIYIAFISISVIYSRYIIPDDSMKYPLYLCFPWNIDVSILASSYLALGMYLRNSSILDKLLRPKYLVAITLIICGFIVIDYMEIADFRLDMKYSVYENFIFITLLPICSFLLLFQLSKLLSTINFLSSFLMMVGKASLYIMYVHLIIKDHFIIPLLGNNYSITLYLFITISISLILYSFIPIVKNYIFSIRSKVPF